MAASLTKIIRMLLCAFLGIVVLFCTGTPRSVSSMAVPTMTSTTSTVTSQQDLPRVDCGPITTASYNAPPLAHQIKILERRTLALVRQPNMFWKSFSKRSGRPTDLENTSDLMDIEGLPDTTALRPEDICDLDRLTTHFFILDGFKKAMDAVIRDEEQYNGSQHFTREFANTTHLLMQVMEATRALVCSSSRQVQSRIQQVENFTFPAYPEHAFITNWRDYTVLYWLRDYTRQFHLYVRSLIGRNPSTVSSNCDQRL